jgi:hypothetical protein
VLALKFHKKSRPFLEKGSYLVPIFNWRSGERLINEWRRTLEHHNQSLPNNQVNFATLVRIPEDLMIAFNPDWINPYPCATTWEGIAQQTVYYYKEEPTTQPAFKSRHDQSVRHGQARRPEPASKCPKELYEWNFWPGKKHFFDPTLGDNDEGSLPEIVLGGPIPKKNILWTKNVRLLRRGDRRSQESSRRLRREITERD